MKSIYKFHVDCGRQGDLQGVFVADDSDIAKIIGERIYFGEVLGKHSDVSKVISEEDLTLVTQDANFIALFEEHELSVGFNPLEYYNSEEDEE